ncbi:cyclohexanone 1,2-monooxygenase [Arthrobacter sp. Hiyo6]|nr:cyclohexanone 1,2-monooxygenase [Arthrobacter sp. Hiyo6]
MTAQTTIQTVDAVVIGAGFGGIYAVHKLHNELGLTTVGFDKANGPGGTWYWNRYRVPCPIRRATYTVSPSTATCCRTVPGSTRTSPSPRSSNTSKG